MSLLFLLLVIAGVLALVGSAYFASRREFHKAIYCLAAVLVVLLVLVLDRTV